MRILSLAVVIVLSLSMFSCKGTKKAKTDVTTEENPKEEKTVYENVASDMCDCSKEMIDIVEKIQKASAEGDNETLMALAPKVESLTPAMTECMQGLEKKYPEMEEKKEDAENEEKMKAALKKECPKLYELMNAQGGM